MLKCIVLVYYWYFVREIDESLKRTYQVLRSPFKWPAVESIVGWWPPAVTCCARSHFLWVPQNQWLSMAEFLESDHSCSMWASSNSNFFLELLFSLAESFWKRHQNLKLFLPNPPSFGLSFHGVNPILRSAAFPWLLLLPLPSFLHKDLTPNKSPACLIPFWGFPENLSWHICQALKSVGYLPLLCLSFSF